MFFTSLEGLVPIKGDVPWYLRYSGDIAFYNAIFGLLPIIMMRTEPAAKSKAGMMVVVMGVGIGGGIGKRIIVWSRILTPVSLIH
ncbi:MAG: hypothetical protein H6Q73_101 [Firmicutes bacterium]|nr:hypothetical protein [Bacillota bacterium]